MRFVLDGEGVVTPDVAARLPGRGFWLSACADVVNTAARKGLFSKGAKQKAIVPDDLEARIESLLVRRALDWIGMARRGGQAVSGLEKAKSWLIQGRAGHYVLARDAGSDSQKRLAGLVRDPDMGIEVLPRLLDSAELGAAFGRATAVHVALEPGGPAERLGLDLARLAGFRQENHGSGAEQSPEHEG